MTKLIYMTGDLFTSDAPALAHGVNCFGVMGAGIAKEFRARYPEMFQHYYQQCKDQTLQPGAVMEWRPGDGPTIYNIASQDKPGGYAQLGWLGAGLVTSLASADRLGYDRIAVPWIGTGIGGLKQPPVEAMMRGAASKFNCDLEIWTYTD